MPVVTLAEIEATGRKAARGCGCPWGMAEEAGKSARWLAAHGLPGAETLAALLSERDGCCTQGGTPCALRRAAALADRTAPADTGPITVESDHPLLTVAQMGRAADAMNRDFTLDCRGNPFTVAPRSLRIGGEDTRIPSAKSRAVGDTAWDTLTGLSRRILVPATEASRAGAGAGTRDTD